MISLSKTLAYIAGGFALLIIVSLIAALPMMLLWDWLMPSIFSLRTITWLEAWGLMALAALLHGTSYRKAP